MHAPARPDLIAPDILLLAYRAGIFPMSDARDDPDVFWVEPRIRAILPLDGFHLSRSLKKTLRRESFEVTCNAAFSRVIEACAAPRPTEGGGSWISERIQASYENLHRLGFAHSIECWREDKLVGGLYGVGFDRVFCGESMFSTVSDASKVALAWLVAAMREGGFELLDCQFQTEHLSTLGAVELPQEEYLALLRDAQRDHSSDESPPSLEEAFSSLLAAPGDASPGYRIAQSLTQTS
ncbi:MAG: leucyl/phenylalanyl-tRNA--protein transferase [Sphingomonadaceae bacterium]